MNLHVATIVGLVVLLWFFVQRAKSKILRQSLLLLASYAFYSTFGLKFLSILILSSLGNFYWGAHLRRNPTSRRLWGGILFNVALLSIFKYLPALSSSFPGPWAESLKAIVLPVGISFWTFQGLSYLFDIYREEELEPTLLEFCLYMGFGPTVLSGPICRLSDLLDQFREPIRPSLKNIREGLERIWLGVFLMTVAQILGGGLLPGTGVDAGFEQSTHRLTAPDVWLLAVGYAFQLFFDFAGYSHIAIGTARLFGFQLPENFNHPYLSTTPSVFWTRWHMSLSFWIRDYVFLPLATLFRSIAWRNFTLVLSMVLFGLWHKPKLTFVMWGAYQGTLLFAHRLWQQSARRFGFDWAGRFQSFVSWAITFFSMCLGWLFFRADDLKAAFALVRTVLTPAGYVGFSLPMQSLKLVILVSLVYFLFEGIRLVCRREDALSLAWMPPEFRFACYGVMLYFVVFRAAQPQGFIYFQF